MDKLPEKLTRKIIRDEKDPSPGVEDSLESEREDNAKQTYFLFQHYLKEHGIDLTRKGIKVLEIGSGTATLLNYMRKQKVNAVGVDVRPRGNKESPQVIARIEQLPFDDEQFDVVLSSETFHHHFYNQNQNSMMEEIIRVLKHGGIYMGRREYIDFKSVKAIKGFEPIPSYFNLFVYKKS